MSDERQNGPRSLAMMRRARYAVVTVTLDPDIEVLRRQLDAIERNACVVLVDNGSEPASRNALEQLVRLRPGASLVCNPDNPGLAAGSNAGAREALRCVPDCALLLFLDQDTEPGAGGVARLVDAVTRLQAADARVGVVGPLMEDARTGLTHGIHVIRGWRWTRDYPAPGEHGAVPCASVNGSGSVIPVTVFRELGGFDEGLFIDHVDSEWSFRVSAAGYRLYTVRDVRFRHKMGAGSVRFWLAGWRVWPYRQPARQYYLFRNAVTLMRRGYVPGVWKVWAAMKLVLTILVHGLAGPDRGRQLGAMYAGLRAGLGGSAGPSLPDSARSAGTKHVAK